MNRIQFWTLNGLSGLVVLLLIIQIFLVKSAVNQQQQMQLAQQAIQQGQAFQGNLKQLALRIVQVSQTSGDQGLKDLLVRQQISFTPTENNSGSAPAPTH